MSRHPVFSRACKRSLRLSLRGALLCSGIAVLAGLVFFQACGNEDDGPVSALLTPGDGVVGGDGVVRGEDTYGMVRLPSVPAVLFEYGYLSNPSEAELFATDEYVRVAAKATADAIDAYLHSDRLGSGYIEKPRLYDPGPTSIPCNDPTLE